jgi:DNA-directed RNA polymerase subunit RPC12/RpoP
VFRCPICSFKAKTLWGLITHVRKTHNNGVCPICGRKFKQISQHYLNLSQACEKHKIMYILTTPVSKKNRFWLREWRDWACEVLEVRE